MLQILEFSTINHSWSVGIIYSLELLSTTVKKQYYLKKYLGNGMDLKRFDDLDFFSDKIVYIIIKKVGMDWQEKWWKSSFKTPPFKRFLRRETCCQWRDILRITLVSQLVFDWYKWCLIEMLLMKIYICPLDKILIKLEFVKHKIVMIFSTNLIRFTYLLYPFVNGRTWFHLMMTPRNGGGNR